MSKQQQIVDIISKLPEEKLDTVLTFIQFINHENQIENAVLSENSLAKEWMLPEEDKAWQDL